MIARLRTRSMAATLLRGATPAEEGPAPRKRSATTDGERLYDRRKRSVVPATAAPPGDARRQAIGLAASALASVGWGFGAIFARLTSAPGLVLTFYRLWLG